MTHRSGEHRIDRMAVRALRTELDAALPPLRAKPLVSAPREPKNSEHAEYLAAHNALIKAGWTVRAIGRHLGVSHRYVLDWRNGNRPARTQGCDWIARMWQMLRDVDAELPSGTWG